MSDLFDTPADATTDTQAPAVTPQFQIPDEVSDLVGPGKKYADPVTALKALKHAQEHIQRIEGDNAELRKLAEKAARVDEVYELVQDLQNRQPTQAGEIDVNAVASLVDSRIQAVKQQEAAKQNMDKFESAFTKAFGDKAKEALAAKAAEVGLTKEAIKDLAQRSPDAALKLFDLKASESYVAPKPLAGSVNTEILAKQPIGTPPKKNIMQGSSASDLVAEWKASAPKLD
jgi:hypothetical protein